MDAHEARQQKYFDDLMERIAIIERLTTLQHIKLIIYFYTDIQSIQILIV